VAAHVVAACVMAAHVVAACVVAVLVLQVLGTQGVGSVMGLRGTVQNASCETLCARVTHWPHTGGGAHPLGGPGSSAWPSRTEHVCAPGWRNGSALGPLALSMCARQGGAMAQRLALLH